MTMRNFGRNIAIDPAAKYRPKCEAEVLEILNRHRGQQIRCVGRLHSWSRVLEADAVLLDLRDLNEVRSDVVEGEPIVHVGAGCQVKRLLSELDRQRGWTLPSVGFITEQSVAGAISTGTHGSGRHSLSHYVLQLRIACYDLETGQAIIKTVSSGDDLLAARCSLGSLGVIVGVTMQCRSKYNVEESFQEYRQISDVLDAEVQYPLQQFYLIPWRWTYFVQHRRESSSPSSRTLLLYLWYRFVVFDIAMHMLILTAVRIIRISRVIRAMFQWLIPACVIRQWSVVGPSNRQLVMEHELFRHQEIELFVQRTDLPDAMKFLKDALLVAENADAPLTTEFESQISKAQCTHEISALRGKYCHHYPICVRKILPDDTLISMASNAGFDSSRKDESWYSITLTNYHSGVAQKPFYKLATFLTVSMSRLFGARPHWGKICPLPPADLLKLYPSFGTFQKVCRQLDDMGVFRNDWTSELILESVPEETDESATKL